MYDAPGVPKGEGLLTGRDVKTHEQLPYSVDVENVGHIGETSGFTELTLAWKSTANIKYQQKTLI